MIPWKKSDFVIKGRRTGSRLAGRENEYVYEIFYNGKLLSDRQFTSKAKANEWLGDFLKYANEVRGRQSDRKT